MYEVFILVILRKSIGVFVVVTIIDASADVLSTPNPRIVFLVPV